MMYAGQSGARTPGSLSMPDAARPKSAGRPSQAQSNKLNPESRRLQQLAALVATEQACATPNRS